jgi:hypothetical protein
MPEPISEPECRHCGFEKSMHHAPELICPAYSTFDPKPPASPGWQPIATAPKDGTRIAVAAYDGEVWQFRTDYWRDYWQGHGQGFGWIVEPTHWMSLPEPPVPLPPASEVIVDGRTCLFFRGPGGRWYIKDGANQIGDKCLHRDGTWRYASSLTPQDEWLFATESAARAFAEQAAQEDQ